ncbi:hypothetical protein y223_00065 [Bordetella phage PY223]
MNGQQYAEQQLDALLPQGLAWPRESDARMRALTRALAEEFARVDARGDDLLREVLPSTTVEMLSDWERAAGLPDPCVPSGQTLQERRNALLSRLAGTGGQSRAFFIELAAYLGFTITITEFRPFRAGISHAGDALYNDDWRHAWRINAPETTIIEFRAGLSAAGEPLRKWGNELLECVLNRIKPAHTVLLFGYGG